MGHTSEATNNMQTETHQKDKKKAGEQNVSPEIKLLDS